MVCGSNANIASSTDEVEVAMVDGESDTDCSMGRLHKKNSSKFYCQQFIRVDNRMKKLQLSDI